VAYQLTSLGIAVLALLRERPMHGYEMFQTLTARHQDRTVKVRQGSLYHAVYRLAEEDLIRPTITGRNGNRPERTTFEITAEGSAALTERVRELVATPVNEFPRFVVALAEIGNLDVGGAEAAVDSRIAALEADFAELQTLKQVSTAPNNQLAALDYLLAMTQAQLDWLRGFVGSLRSGQVGWHRAAGADTIEGSRSEVGV
jgi:DNA-binding PadR family transcriptional regulator